jgi:hypothetical protein
LVAQNMFPMMPVMPYFGLGRVYGCVTTLALI